MKLARSYTLAEYLIWTRRKIFLLLLIAIVPVALYQLLGQKWIAAPWAVAAVLGTAASFTVGFKNLQTYNRTAEALQIWTAIAAISRYWGLIARDFPTKPESTQLLIYRHLAWLTVLRYGLRAGAARKWESVTSPSNAEYKRKYFTVPEQQSPLEDELPKYLPAPELALLAATENKATRLLDLQSGTIRTLYAGQALAVLHHTEMQKTLKDFLDQQARVERIKNYPYPRQYATINTLFVWCFAGLLPLCLIREFDRLNDNVSGLIQGHMAWLAVPFSVLISWIYVSLDQVGESTENPFEGSANDVPIAQISRAVEIDLRGMLGETELPAAVEVRNEIVM
jgi:putative membrane protein